jgi:protein-tyrosine phosphatase
VTFPDGTRVLASGWLERTSHEPKPDFGLYLDPAWSPTWPAVLLDWPDFGVPADWQAADAAIRDAFERARAGQTVEVACIGGHGRTGTVLACMAILAGVPPSEAVEWVRARYCRRAVQEPGQQYWIERWAERTAGE